MLMAKAEEELAYRGGLLQSIFGGSSNFKEEAAETFVKAANSFMLAGAWSLAGGAFEKAAAAYAECSNMSEEAASKYADAARAYKSVDLLKAVAAHKKAIQIYTNAAMFQQCGMLKGEVAHTEEALNSLEAALEACHALADLEDVKDA